MNFAVALPIGITGAAPAFTDLATAIGVGVSSSVIPDVRDQLAMTRLPRATYALMVSLVPTAAMVIEIVVLTKIPTTHEIAGVVLVIHGVALLQKLHPNGADDAVPKQGRRARHLGELLAAGSWSFARRS
jgi:inner membrane transporter RhtA